MSSHPWPSPFPTPGGCTWARTWAAATGLPFRGTALAVDPQNPGRAFVGTDAFGVFRSLDSGATWTAVNTGLPILPVQAIAIHPVTPSTLYVGTIGGLFKSTVVDLTIDVNGYFR